jgi:DNA-binding response OmpR family regulator
VAAPWPRYEKTVARPALTAGPENLWNTLRVSRVLVVEDEAHIRELIQLHLGLEGLDVEAVGDGQEALGRAHDDPFDLIILDLMLPGVDGIAVCRAVRRDGANQDVPILMLTARTEESDKVLGLESGADDYLAKPFGIRELVARARALLRRPRRSQLRAEAAAPGDRPIEIHGLHIDPARRRVRAKGRDIDLTAQEFRLLLVLATHPGIVFSREALLTRVWPDHTFVTERSVDSLVKRLRRRIEKDPANPEVILTVWGSGYKCADV